MHYRTFYGDAKTEMLSWGTLEQDGESYHYDQFIDWWLDSKGNRYAYNTSLDLEMSQKAKQYGSIIIEVNNPERIILSLIPSEDNNA